MSEAAISLLSGWIKDQKPQGPQMKDAPTFYRNLEEALDLRRADHSMFVSVKGISNSQCEINLADLPFSL